VVWSEKRLRFLEAKQLSRNTSPSLEKSGLITRNVELGGWKNDNRQENSRKIKKCKASKERSIHFFSTLHTAHCSEILRDVFISGSG